MKNFLLFAALCSLLTVMTTILIHNFPYEQMSFDERALLYQDSSYFNQRLLIIIHCFLFLIAMWGIFLLLHKKVFAFGGLGFLFFTLFSITEIIRQLSMIFYLNGLRENYLETTNASIKEIIKINIENFGFINYTLFTIFILSFGLGAIFYGLSLLQLNKKSISSFNLLGGRPPGSHNCDIVDPGPITIETICWTESRDAGSDCWCSSDDSFHCGLATKKWTIS